MCAAADADCDHRLIIKSFHACRVVGDCFEDLIDQLFGGAAVVLLNDLLNPPAPKQVPPAVSRIENAIAEEYKQISGLHLEMKFVILCLIEKTQRQTGRLDHLALSSVDKDRAGKTRVRDS